MEKSEKIIEKLLDQTAKKEIQWTSRTYFSNDESLPYFSDPNFIFNESYFYSYTPHSPSAYDHPQGGTFYLSSFSDNSDRAKIILGFSKDTYSDYVVLSENQIKLFELKALIEYEEPEKDVSAILDDFLNDKN